LSRRPDTSSSDDGTEVLRQRSGAAFAELLLSRHSHLVNRLPRIVGAIMIQSWDGWLLRC